MWGLRVQILTHVFLYVLLHPPQSFTVSYIL